MHIQVMSKMGEDIRSMAERADFLVLMLLECLLAIDFSSLIAG